MLTSTIVDFTLEPTDLEGTPVQSVAHGADFYLNFYVQDKRPGPPPADAPAADGVFAAYADLLYDANLTVLTGAIEFGEEYQNGQEGNVSVAGEVDELGAFSNIPTLGDSRYLLARLPMRATEIGTAAFTTNQADILPAHDTLVYFGSQPVTPGEISYGSFDLEILNSPVVIDNGDSGFTATSGFNSWSNAGHQGDLHYANSAANAASADTATWQFTGLARGEYQVWTTWSLDGTARPTNAPYTITDSDGVETVVTVNQTIEPAGLDDNGTKWQELTTARVANGQLKVELKTSPVDSRWVIADAIRIQNIADIPVAIDDVLTTSSGASSSVVVLQNDEPAVGTTLTVTSVSNPSHGSVVLNQDGTITYSAGASYIGNDSFEYTVTDTNDRTDVGEVAVTVNAPPPGSEAVDDGVHTTMVTPITVAVLQNDVAAQGATLSLGNADPPANGTTVANSNGTVTYTPNAGFVGQDEFTYLMVDSFGKTDTGTVTVTVTPIVHTRMDVTNASGTVIDNANIGEDVFLNIYVQDQRPVPRGVFAAYFDALYDENYVSLNGSVAFGDQYLNGQNSNTETAGLIDEVGAFSDIPELGASERLLARIPLTATAAGTAQFSLDAADILPLHESLVYGESAVPVGADQTVFGQTALTINFPVFIIDDGDDAPSYTSTVGFHDWGNAGHDGDLQYANTSDVVGEASADVAPGKYRVSTTWTLDNSSRPTNAPYTVENNDGVVATVAIDQTAAPNDRRFRLGRPCC